MPSANPTHPWDIPPEHVLIAFDIKDFSKTPEHRQPQLKHALNLALESAFHQSDLAAEWDQPVYRQDTGDGYILVLPPARTWRLVDPLIRNLDDELNGYDERREREDSSLLIRVSIHIGPMPPSNLADAINDVARLVDSDAARTGITAAAAHGSYTALTLSDEMYHRVVLAKRSKLHPTRDFLAAEATVPGKGFNRPAWIHVPRLSPSVVAQHLPLAEPIADQPLHETEAAAVPHGIHLSGQVNVNTMANHIDTLRTRQNIG